MRIRSFGLERYGAFEGREVAFGAGLTLVVGDNETGKSTTLAGLSDLLWGFRPRHQDHTFAVGTLSLTARLDLPGGQEVDVRRRRTGLSTSPDGQPFAPLWGHDGRELWRRAFGLSLADLRDGADAVFRGAGDLAELVFAARSGRAVHELAQALEKERDGLYKSHGNGRRSQVRAAWNEFTRARDGVEDAMVNGELVAVAETELARHEGRARAAAARLGSAAARHARAEQRCRAMAEVQTLLGLRAERARLLDGGLVLPAGQLDAFDAVLDVLDDLDTATGETGWLRAEHDEKAAERAELRLDEALLTDGDAISRLERHVEARTGDTAVAADHDRAAAEQAGEAIRLLHDLVGPDDPRPAGELLAALHVPVDVAAGLDALGARVDALGAEVAQAEETVRVACAREDAAATVAPHDPMLIGLLRDVVTTIRADGSASALFRASVDSAATALGDRRDALRHAGAGVVDAAAPAAPSRERVRDACQRLAAAEDAWDGTATQAAAAGQAVEQAGQQLARKADGQRLPDPAALARVRAERDDLWARLTKAAADGLSAARAEELLPCLATTTRRADDLADDLLAHASAAAKHAQLQRALAEATERHRDALTAHEHAHHARDQARRDWDAFWTDLGLTPPTPEQADDVRRALDDAQAAQTTLLAAERRGTALSAQADAQRATLTEALTALGQPPSGGDLDTVLAAAERILTDDDAAREERASTALHARQTTEARRAHAGKTVELDTAQEQWAAAARTAGLPATMTPPGWVARRGTLAQAQAAHHAATQARASAADARRRLDAFTEEIAALATRHGEDGPGDATPAAVLDRLAARLRGACEAQAAAKVLDRAVAELTDRLDSAAEQHATATARLDRLRDEAGLSRDQPLADILDRSRAVQAVRAQETATAAMIRTAAPEDDLETLVKELADRDDADLDRDLTAAAEDRDACSAAQDAAAQVLGASRERLRQLRDGRSVAEQHAQAQEHLALVAEGAERYLIATIAQQLLREQLEAHARRHTSPLLGDAGRLLERLTGGTCVALRAEDRGDQRSLRVVRADELERAPGELSEGTADQVYLALRLAAIDQLQRDRAARGDVPLPVVLDDVLMAFDDHRAVAALHVLAELARHWQIIVFSHHRHLADLVAADPVLAAATQISRLPQVTPPPGLRAADRIRASVATATATAGPGDIAVARSSLPSASSGRPPRERPSAPAVDHDRTEIRRWAREHGYHVGDRGRIAQNIIDAFHQAHAH
ncbi:histone-like nucleoid-structuring protein Lsr2 [Frankia sp. AgB32]|uniref:AAA family ATPase n=1 Tax=Frankia sp. AgB32 TaxID=631119 RepID=UPI00200F65B9|nr:histone-like nucleoid-structuring protein Lsr2 [Frankia sp. AgB32]MCK9894427.1 AAA family ATPase [Frankia sp. AgB32]